MWPRLRASWRPGNRRGGQYLGPRLQCGHDSEHRGDYPAEVLWRSATAPSMWPRLRASWRLLTWFEDPLRTVGPSMWPRLRASWRPRSRRVCGIRPSTFNVATTQSIVETRYSMSDGWPQTDLQCGHDSEHRGDLRRKYACSARTCAFNVATTQSIVETAGALEGILAAAINLQCGHDSEHRGDWQEFTGVTP